MTIGVYGRTREDRLHQVVEHVATVLQGETQQRYTNNTPACTKIAQAAPLLAAGGMSWITQHESRLACSLP